MIRCRSSILNWTGPEWIRLVALSADFTCCWHFSSIEFLLAVWIFSAIAVNSKREGNRKKSFKLGRRLNINPRNDSEQNTNRQQKRQNNWRMGHFAGAVLITNLNNSIINFTKEISDFDDGLWRHDSALLYIDSTLCNLHPLWLVLMCSVCRAVRVQRTRSLILYYFCWLPLAQTPSR